MRSLSFHSDIRSVAALSFLRAEPQSLPSPGPEAVGGPCARRLGKKSKKIKDSIALALSFVFTVIIAGPFIRYATKEAQAAQSLCCLSILYFNDINVVFSNVITLFICYFHCSKQDESFQINTICTTIIINNLKHFTHWFSSRNRVCALSADCCNKSTTDLIIGVNNCIVWEHFKDCAM